MSIVSFGYKIWLAEISVIISCKFLKSERKKKTLRTSVDCVTDDRVAIPKEAMKLMQKAALSQSLIKTFLSDRDRDRGGGGWGFNHSLATITLMLCATMYTKCSKMHSHIS